MANKFQIEIVALDRSTAVFRKINNEMSKVFRPVTNAQRQFVALGREMHLEKLTKGLRGLSEAGAKVASSLGLSAGPMEAIFGLGAAGGFVAAGAAIVSLGARWGNLGFEVGRTAQTIGVSTDVLQKYRGAAKLAGLSQEALTESFSNLGKTLQDAANGRNAPAYALLNKLGIGIRRTKDGVVDVEGTFDDLAEALAKNTNPQVRELVTGMFGIGPMLPMLRMGREEIARLKAEAVASGMVMGGGAVEGATKWRESLDRLEGAIEGVANAWGQKLAPMLTPVMDKVTEGLTSKGGFWSRVRAFSEGYSMLGHYGFEPDAGAGRRSMSGTVTDATGSAAGLAAAGSRADKLAFLAKLEQQKGLPAGMLKGVWGTESSFGTNTGKSSAGAEGNFQFMPGTAAQYGVKIGDFESEATGAAAYLSDLYAQRGSWKGALFGYNGVRNNTAAGEKYVNDVAANSEATPQTVNIRVAVANAPPGTRVTSSGPGAAGMRISYSLPQGDTP